MHARLHLSKIVAEDKLRFAFRVEAVAGSGPPPGISWLFDWQKTLASMRLHVDGEGNSVTLELEKEPQTEMDYINPSTSTVRELMIDGNGLGSLAWKKPEPNLLKKPGRYTLVIEAVFHINSKTFAFGGKPLPFEVVAASDAFQPLAALATIAQSAATSHLGSSASPDPQANPIDDIADNRWFRFSKDIPQKEYEVRIVEVLVSPAGKVVTVDAFEHFTCVANGTKITTPTGAVAIETLAIGDRVLGYDAEHDSFVETTVRRILPSTSDELFDVNGLLVTGEHPIFNDGAWTRARDLAPGSLLLRHDGTPLELASIGVLSARTRVYDLSVDWPHNFFADDLLVHNKAAYVPVGPPKDPWHGIFSRAAAK